MQTLSLPKTIDPFRFAAMGRQLSGVLSVSTMSRLLPDLLSDRSEVKFSLIFGVEPSTEVSWLKGEVNTCLELQCQRCLKSFNYDIIARFNLGLVRKTSEANNLPTHFEPFIVEGPLVLQDVIEEELIVNLPIVPRHPAEICRITEAV